MYRFVGNGKMCGRWARPRPAQPRPPRGTGPSQGGRRRHASPQTRPRVRERRQGGGGARCREVRPGRVALWRWFSVESMEAWRGCASVRQGAAWESETPRPENGAFASTTRGASRTLQLLERVVRRPGVHAGPVRLVPDESNSGHRKDLAKVAGIRLLKHVHLACRTIGRRPRRDECGIDHCRGVTPGAQ